MANPNNNLNATLPELNTTPVVDSNGVVTPAWFLFFLQLWRRTGSGNGGDGQLTYADVISFDQTFGPELLMQPSENRTADMVGSPVSAVATKYADITQAAQSAAPRTTDLVIPSASAIKPSLSEMTQSFAPVSAQMADMILAPSSGLSGQIAGDVLTYGNASGQSIPNNAATTLTNWTKINDKNSANFNATTGTYTAPAAGYYAVSGQLLFAQILPIAIGNQFDMYVLVNGSVIAIAYYFINALTNNFRDISLATRTFYLNKGDQITFQGFQNSGTGGALTPFTSNNWITIIQLP